MKAALSQLWDRIQAEPALVTTFITACVALASSFGFDLSPEQVGGITAVTAAVMGIITRQNVRPLVKLRAEDVPHKPVR